MYKMHFSQSLPKSKLKAKSKSQSKAKPSSKLVPKLQRDSVPPPYLVPAPAPAPELEPELTPKLIEKKTLFLWEYLFTGLDFKKLTILDVLLMKEMALLDINIPDAVKALIF